MELFQSDGVRIAYMVEGAGEPIVLVHGFASNTEANWIDTGWVRTLAAAGRKVIALDNRGHGQSDKPREAKAYSTLIMAEDVRRLMDHLGVSRADVMGYSMGARIATFLSFTHPDRVRSAVFAGVGDNMLHGMVGAGPIAAALEARYVEDIDDDEARQVRAFAEQTNSDLKALAVCIRASREPISADMLSRITAPVLVVVGTKDTIAGSGAALADLIPNAQLLQLRNRDHMTAVGDRNYKRGVLAFLADRA